MVAAHTVYLLCNSPPLVPSEMTFLSAWSLLHCLQHLLPQTSFLLVVVDWVRQLVVQMIMCLSATHQAEVHHLKQKNVQPNISVSRQIYQVNFWRLKYVCFEGLWRPIFQIHIWHGKSGRRATLWMCHCYSHLFILLLYSTSNFSTPTKKATFLINYVCLSVFLPTCVWYRMTLYHKIQQVLRSVILPLLTSSRCSWRYILI